MSGEQGSTVEGFVDAVAVGPDDRARRVALFQAVRNLPYATDNAFDAEGLVNARRGNCLAKADLLWRGFRRMGVEVRRVKWRYDLPANPPEVALLSSRCDVHTAVEISIEGRWILVDATHDPPLAAAGLTVAEWDGVNPTVPNYAPSGPVWREGEHDGEIGAALAVISAQYGRTPSGAERYLAAFNEWLESLRCGGGSH